MALVALLAALSCGCQGSLEVSDQVDDPQSGPPPEEAPDSKEPALKDPTSLADMDPTEAEVDGGDSRTDMDGVSSMDQGDLPECDTPQDFLERSAWSSVVEPVCVGCHIEGGIAPSQGSELVLWSNVTLTTQPELSLDEFFAHNTEQLRAVSSGLPGAQAVFVRKALGQLGHGGGAPIKEGTEQLEALIELADRFAEPIEEDCQQAESGDQLEDSLLMHDPVQTYRKAAILFGARLPTQAELSAIENASGEQAWAEVERLTLGLFQEPAFHEWIKYAWNEVLSLRGMREVDTGTISTADFSAKSWSFMSEDKAGFKCSDSWEGVTNWQRFNYQSLDHCDGPGLRRGVSRRNGWSLIEGPLEFIAWLVKQGRPFGEILTSDKIAMNYYSSLTYYGSARPQENPLVAAHMNELEIEVVNFAGEGGAWGGISLPQMDKYYIMDSVKRTGATSTPLPDNGRRYSWHYHDVAQYPRAGLLTDQVFLNRYPTSATNVNRHRSWAFFELFLGVDILALADRRGDPTEAELGSDQPTIDDANCNVCHNVMDPVAGMFQDFADKGQWQPDDIWPPIDQPPMIAAGFSSLGASVGELYEPDVHGPSPLLALAERTVADPRFARRMVEHAFFQVIGRYPLELPEAADTPQGQGARQAYEIERAYLAQATDHFVESNYDMCALLSHLVRSSFFRARGVKPGVSLTDPVTASALSAWGSGLLRTPELLHRQIEAALGRPWPVEALDLDDTFFVKSTDLPWNDFLVRSNEGDGQRHLIGDEFRDMYGGIDFMVYTVRLRRPSSTMAAVAARVANEVACLTVAPEFTVPDASRLIFSGASALDTAPTHEVAIRAAIKRLHERFLGGHRTGQLELDQSYELFSKVQREGAAEIAANTVSAELSRHCRVSEPMPGLAGQFSPVTQDPNYTLRAYMAVVTALVLDPEFLLEP